MSHGFLFGFVDSHLTLIYFPQRVPCIQTRLREDGRWTFSTPIATATDANSHSIFVPQCLLEVVRFEVHVMSKSGVLKMTSRVHAATGGIENEHDTPTYLFQLRTHACDSFYMFLRICIIKALCYISKHAYVAISIYNWVTPSILSIAMWWICAARFPIWRRCCHIVTAILNMIPKPSFVCVARQVKGFNETFWKLQTASPG